MISYFQNNSGRPSILFLLMLYVSISATAQIPQSMSEATNTRMGGNNYIVGSIFWPSGHPADVRIGIKLRSLTGGDFVTTTDPDGKFIFAGVSQGLYDVIVDGEKEFEPIRHRIDVIQSKNPTPQYYNVSIRLTYTKATIAIHASKTVAKPTVIKADNAGVPKRALVFYEKALELSNTKDHRGAIEQLKLAIEQYPDFMNAFNEMGVQYLKLNELEKADEALLAALKIKPDAMEPLVNRGITLFRLNRFRDAEPVLQMALKINDQSAVGHYYMGRTLAKLKRYNEAEKELYFSISLSPDEMKEAHRILAMMFIDTDDRRRAIAELETYLKLAPSAPDAEQLKQALKQLKGATANPGSEPPA
jgi:predicted Zn-dependent protease